MRTSARTMVLLGLLGIAAFVGWYLARPVVTLPNPPGGDLPRPVVASPYPATGDLPPVIPVWCDYPELAILTPSAMNIPAGPNRDRWAAKQEAVKSAVLNCIWSLTAVPIGTKPSPPSPPPTGSPVATPTLVVGLAHKRLISAGYSFVPEYDGINSWGGYVNGDVVEIAVGWMRETDENWRQDHPEWVAQGPQGAIVVMVNYSAAYGKSGIYITPSRHGRVHFVAACGTTLVLEAADGTIFTFDAAEMRYVENTSTCAAPSP